MTTKGTKNEAVQGVFAAMGVMAVYCGIDMLSTGKAGRNGQFSTPQNEPVLYWLQVIGAFSVGAVILVHAAYLILFDRSDNEPPDSTTHT